MTANVKPVTAIDWPEIEQRLLSWAKDITSLDAIWAEENGPQPDKPYVMLDWLVPAEVMGEDYLTDEIQDDQTLSRFLNGVRKGTLDVQVFARTSRAAESALLYCDMLQSTFVIDDVRQKYFDPLMAVWDFTQIRRIPNYVEDKRFRSRAGFEMYLGFSAGARLVNPDPIVEGAGRISSVAITGSVMAGTETITQSILVSEDEA